MSSSGWYSQWRRSEAYAVPMTTKGERDAEDRMKQFSVGWEYGMQYAIKQLEDAHRENKHVHKFFLIAKEQLEYALSENRKDIRDMRRKV